MEDCLVCWGMFEDTRVFSTDRLVITILSKKDSLAEYKAEAEE